MSILENEKANLAAAIEKRENAGRNVVSGKGGLRSLADFEQSSSLICMIESSIRKIENI